MGRNRLMAELQQLFTQWVSNVANLIPLGYAFGAGMVSAVNPCGFAMLPAYLGLYLGSRDLVSGASAGSMHPTASLTATVIPALPLMTVMAAMALSTMWGGWRSGKRGTSDKLPMRT